RSRQGKGSPEAKSPTNVPNKSYVTSCNLLAEILHGISLIFDQYGPEVINIRTRRPRDDEIAERRKEAIGIIVGEKGLCIEAFGACTCQSVWHDQSTGIVFRAIDPVRISRNRGYIGLAVECDGEPEREFAIAPAAPLALERHCRFAPRQDDSGPLCGECPGRLFAGDIARFAFHPITEIDHPVTGLLGKLRRRSERLGGGRDHCGPHPAKTR